MAGSILADLIEFEFMSFGTGEKKKDLALTQEDRRS
jgi:hypothetical protein